MARTRRWRGRWGGTTKVAVDDPLRGGDPAGVRAAVDRGGDLCGGRRDLVHPRPPDRKSGGERRRVARQKKRTARRRPGPSTFLALPPCAVRRLRRGHHRDADPVAALLRPRHLHVVAAGGERLVGETERQGRETRIA